MTNPPAAEKFIHFQLEQMSSRNEHHRFEEICFRVARRRISNNVKLATGPVSAGGDQGRDVESFVTWLPEQQPHAKGFVGRASAKPVVVACTLQKDGLPTKVKDDLAKICGGAGVPVEYVAFYSVVPIPAAKLHELEQWARDTYDLTLEIFDGITLASMLAESDLVWVAQEYLELPSNMVPDYPGEEPAPEWYRDLLGRCRRGEVTALTPGDLAQVRPGLRHATRDDEVKADLPEWLGFMARFLDPAAGVSHEVGMRARYEIAVAHIRGLESLTAVETPIRDFVRHAVASASLALLEDAQVLLMYFGGAMGHGVDKDTRTVTPDELASLHSELVNTVASLRAATDSATHPVRNARLLQLEALLALHPAYSRMTAPAEPTELAEPVETDGAQAGDDIPPLIQATSGAADEPLDVAADERSEYGDDTEADFIDASWLADVERAMLLLGELVDLLPRVPAFPVDTLSGQFDLLAPVLVDETGYGKVRDGLDAAMERLEGDAAAAHRCRNRAMKFLDMDRPFDALREFHAAKAKWWHGDTLRGSLLAMRMIARIYSSLGMTLAAKQYRLTAASLAMTSDKDDLHEMVADALVEGMDSAFQQGAWLDAVGLAQVAVMARNALVADAFDYEKHKEILQILDFDVTTCVHVARQYWPSLEHVVLTALGSTGWEVALLELVEETTEAYGEPDESAFLRRADSDLCGTPFGDAGPMRTITFAGLGTRWYVEVVNERLAVLAAERFCAAAQILLCELVDLDPLLVPQDVRIAIRIGKPLGTEERIHIKPSNTGLECTVFLTPYAEDHSREALEFETFAVLGVLLHSMSMRSNEDVAEVIEETAKSGLLHKMNIGRPYDEVASLLDAEHYSACRASQVADRTEPFVPTEAEELAPPSGPGPGYGYDESLQSVRNRYERVGDLFGLTLARVLADARVRGILADLRDEGWLDWHLITAVANVATTARARQQGLLGPGRIDRQALAKLFHTRETEQLPVLDLKEFTAESLRMTLDTVAMTVGQGWGLTPPTQTPNLKAWVTVLRERYGYASDDVPHLDLLSGDALDEQGQLRPLLLGSGA